MKLPKNTLKKLYEAPTTGFECGSVLTIVEVRDSLQNVAISVERLWSTDATGGVSV